MGAASPYEVTAVLGDAWARRSPGVEVVAHPLSRGGRGLVAALSNGDPEPLAVAGALGSTTLLADGTLVVESAQAPGTGGPLSSYPLGRLLGTAVELPGVRRLVIATGDLPFLDGGLGMLQAMAGRADEPLEQDLDWLRELRLRWVSTPVLAACSHSLPLLGFHGAASFAQDTLGLDRQASQDAESALGRYVDRLRRVLPPRRDLLTGKDRRLDREPGAGAGGGIAFALALLGAQLRPGAQLCAELAHTDDQVAAADLVVLGEDVFDWRSLQDTVPARVGELAAARGRPVVVLAREAHVGRRESASLGVSGVYSTVPAGRLGSDTRGGGLQPLDALGELATRVAGTWTPT